MRKLVVLFALAAIGFSANAGVIASGNCGASNNLLWELTDDGTLTITGSGKMKDFLTETSSPWYSYRTQITKIVLPDGLTSIGNESFYGCNISSVSIPNSVEIIGRGSFANCSELTSVVIPNSVTKLLQSTFIYCSKLHKVTLGSSVEKLEYVVFKGCTALDSIICKSTTPPEFNTGVATHSFDGVSLNDIKIIVPCGKGFDYKASDWGGEFGLSNIIEDCGTGINENVLNEKVVYPSQTSSSFYVDCEGSYTVKMYDVSGKEVLNQNSNDKTEINISHLAKGVYVVRLFSETKAIGHSKIVKE
ncbi:MAG: leucine-rich repeat domain-containing protein [Lentimicrobiaceae bacterium]|nr:leucine-rich repeat domain-containing protein [Lentimicrobiaceae bacterium]